MRFSFLLTIFFGGVGGGLECVFFVEFRYVHEEFCELIGAYSNA